MPVNILHISDLHRDSGSQLTTTTLLHSLVRDRERYCDDGRTPPDIAIVSGDIVYGVGATDADADTKLAAQYGEALEFLSKIADKFFEGNRERIVLVPGNHDVSMPHVVRSTETIIPDTPEKKKLLTSKLFEKNSIYRWDWSSFCARSIINDKHYDEKMLPFSKFYSEFYLGKRSFPVTPSEQFSIHDFPDFNICFAALSSCYENDLYNRTGRIHPDALANAMDGIAQLAKQGRVACAVWHHNLEGGPKDTDYVDPAFLQSLMDSRCSIGFHGHQHRPQLLQHRFSADATRGISIISAGTLCGGPRSLPTGRLRSYNIIEIDTISRKGKVNIRHMANSDFASPIWGPGHDPDFNGDSVQFDFSGHNQNKINPMELASQADSLIRKGKHGDAFKIAQRDLTNAYLRRVGLTALQNLSNWKGITENFSPPSNAEELLALLEAYDHLMDWDNLRLLLQKIPPQWQKNIAVIHAVESANSALKGK